MSSRGPPSLRQHCNLRHTARYFLQSGTLEIGFELLSLVLKCVIQLFCCLGVLGTAQQASNPFRNRTTLISRLFRVIPNPRPKGESSVPMHSCSSVQLLPCISRPSCFTPPWPQETLLVLLHLKFLTPPTPTTPPAPPAAPMVLLPLQMEIFLEHLLQVILVAFRPVPSASSRSFARPATMVSRAYCWSHITDCSSSRCP